MSFSGKLSPLQLNAVGELSNDSGFSINATAIENQGSWTPTGYTQGSLTSGTVLDYLTRSIPLLYTAAQSSVITRTLYRSVLNIGAGNCPALGNSKPSTFIPTYPGYGSWTGSTLNQDNYPPKEYPTSGTYSYIQQTYGNYAYVTGWPGRNSWQKTTDTYKAATPNSDDSDDYFQHGFIGTIARQAYYELWGGTFSRYNNIVNSFNQNSQWRTQTNQKIASFVNLKTFMSGAPSNANDLGTTNIDGVNRALSLFGTDLINLGTSVNLSTIRKFGTPSVLLQTIQQSGSIMTSIILALSLCGLTDAEISAIIKNDVVPTPGQEKKIYQAFTLVKAEDIYNEQTGIAIGLNLKTKGLTSLADLLNPLKMFPLSCNSLTVPEYKVNGGTAKVYHLIYKNNALSLNPATLNDGMREQIEALNDILPPDVGIGCCAFRYAMGQISIRGMDFARFAQAVTNLETVSRFLPLIDINTGIPSNVTVANQMLNSIALGSGNGGVYRQCDFYGAASGYPYNGYYSTIKELLKQLPTAELESVYQQIYTASVTPNPTVLESLIAQANTIINSIYLNNTGTCDLINYYWNMLGTQMAIEQRAIPYSIPVTTNVDGIIDPNDFYTFAQSLDSYAVDNGSGQNAKTLEAISDITVLGGQAMIASMRETRNAARLGIAGTQLNNNVDNQLDACAASATATLSGGRITAITMTSHSGGYTNENPPNIYITPAGLGAVLKPVIAPDGSIATLTIQSSGSGYQYAEITIDPPPQCQPADPLTDIIPPDLVNPASNSPTVQEAIHDVTVCNCDCWN